MEETLQQEKQESEYKNPSEDQGGIRRRLRDRDLLRKRKAEAEEKETNQWVFGAESQRKRSRTDEKSGTKKRGRPRKTDPTPEITVIQEEAAVAQEAPAVVVVPEPVGIISDTAPIPVQDSAPAPDAVPVPAPALSRAPVPAAAPAPPQVETLYTESQGREALDQVLIEDLGPDEEEDINPLQDKGADEDLSETPLVNVPEQNKMFSIPTLSSPPLPQEYLPGN
ncbi:hemogen isoform X3 [Trachinotus anak]|uniref:hemogen isoform X3 n=1 Tax=Trachinotus anak TaxID=443729 RepID=UPI0039F1B35A